MSRRVAGVAAALLLLTVAAGCTERAVTEPTITLAEANQRVDQHIREAVAQLPGKLRLHERGRSEDFPCDDPTDQGPAGRKIADRNYEILGIDPDKIPSYFDTLREWWTSHNYGILDNDPKYEYLWVQHKSDGFRLALTANDQGHLYIMASSPCVWPNGTPEPQADGRPPSRDEGV